MVGILLAPVLYRVYVMRHRLTPITPICIGCIYPHVSAHIASADTRRAELQQRTGVNGETIKLAEFCLTMSVVSACLIFGPSFVAQWVQRGPELDPSVSRSQTLLPSGIGGVDAYLIQTGVYSSARRRACLARGAGGGPLAWCWWWVAGVVLVVGRRVSMSLSLSLAGRGWRE